MEVRQTPRFSKWLAGLSDRIAYRQITLRIARIEAGNLGDAKSVGGQVSEVRVDVGQGYRVYFTRRANQLILLLWGGGKGSQARDIKRAQAMAAALD